MDARYCAAKTPEARLAAIAAEVVRDVQRKHPKGIADAADFEQVFKPYIDRELFSARLEQSVRDKAGIESDAAKLRDKLMNLAENLPPGLRDESPRGGS